MSCAIGDHVEGFRRPVLDLDADVLAGRVDAVLDDGPERVVGLAVGDDDDASVGRLSRGRRRGREGERRRSGQARDE